MGFVPLAFRAAGRTTIEKLKRKTGSAAGGVHIFWQKPVRQEDVDQARRGEFRGWWYPYETNGGAMMESRVILPLPPEVQWDEATPVVLPGAARREAEQRLLEDKVEEVSLRERETKRAHRKGNNAKSPSRQDAKKNGMGAGKLPGAPRAVVSYGFGAGSGFGEPAEGPKRDAAAPPELAAERAARDAELSRIKEEKDAAKQALKAAQRKSDPEVVAYARELRDRWQECVAEQPGMLEGKLRGKYGVGRMLAPGNGPGSPPGNVPGVAPQQQAGAVEIVSEVMAARKRLDAA